MLRHVKLLLVIVSIFLLSSQKVKAQTYTCSTDGSSNDQVAYGVVNCTLRAGQGSFPVNTDIYLSQVCLYLKKNGTPNWNYWVEVYKANATKDYMGSSSTVINGNSLTTSFAQTCFDFDSLYLQGFSSGYIYLLVVDSARCNTSNNFVYVKGQRSNVCATGQRWLYSLNSGTWTWTNSSNMDRDIDVFTTTPTPTPANQLEFLEFSTQSANAIGDGFTVYSYFLVSTAFIVSAVVAYLSITRS